MRTTSNISMPPKMKSRVDYLVKTNNYSSVSELFRDALRALEDAKLIEGIMESEREFAAGKGKKLRSLRDLV
jgi:Arc/MetJ-type ribon-helix-helix transcriptional regulator